ncbi:T9SS type A sorting domain-containing protein, partial [candidate division WOR-3 bacterium]|nr:T9SS type A sorting domain-containing protein [candidate division WOR-3 bacterium]
IVYLNADNNLETYGIQNLNRMETVGSSDDINIIVQIDRAVGYDNSNGNWTSCRRYYVTRDNGSSTINSTLISDLGEVDMGSPTTLKTFVNWAIDNYPADHYFVEIWNHGDGWYKDGQTESPLFKGASVDNSSGRQIDVSNGELATALSGIKSHLGRKMDLFGFDCCLMAMWEVMDVCRNYVDVFIGSEEIEYAPGWYYPSFLNSLRSNPNMSAVNLGKAVINGSSQPTLAVVDPLLISTVTSKVDIFAQKLIQARGDGYTNTINTARNNTRHFQISSHIDLYDFAYNVANTSVPSYLKTAANDVKSSITSAVEATHNYSSYSDAHGIAIYHPTSASQYDNRYDNLAITSTKWDEYLKGASGGGGGDWTEISYSVSSPHYYSNNYDHTWTITKSGASKMKVHFSAFNTESNYDYVYIYDGSNNQIARYDGNKGAFWSAEVSGSVIKVRLVTDYSVTRYGFDIDKYAYQTGGGMSSGSLPDKFAMTQNIPNPFIDKTLIKYQIPTLKPVNIKIYNSVGRLVTTLVNEVQEPGYYSIGWNGKDSRGNKVGTGIYFCKFITDEYSKSMKLIKIR